MAHMPFDPHDKERAKVLIERALRRGGTTKAELAGALFVSPSVLSRKLGPRYPFQRFSEDEVRTVADFLGLDADERRALLSWHGHVAAATPRPAPSDAASGPAQPADAKRSNLPAPLSSFVGREQEMAEVRRLLGMTRLLTLAGTGGCGKTRLAVEVGMDVRAYYRDGVWLVELAALADPVLVPQAVASALGVREQSGRPLIETLTTALASRHMLLILDNCEHLIDACVALVAALLRACPGLQVMATSREPLQVLGETVWQVPSLAVPATWQAGRATAEGLPGLLTFDAVRLFAERAGSALPSFALTASAAPAVVEICRRLDGIPLALELAAVHVSAMAPGDIAARLDERFRLLVKGNRAALPRQQTLKATLDWSYDLLSEAERQTLRRVAVFAGGLTVEAAEAVCVDGVFVEEVARHLRSLTSKSLLAVDESIAVAGATEPPADAPPSSSRGAPGRYAMLETVRQYAADQLRSVGEARMIQERHRNWYLALAEHAKPLLWGAGEAAWLARLELEHDNLRAALRWTIDERQAEHALRLAEALSRFWTLRGYLSEADGWLTEALALPDAPVSMLQAKARLAAGNVERIQGDYARAAGLYEQGLALSRQLGDGDGIAACLNSLAIVARLQGEFPRAIALCEECLALRRQQGDVRGIANALTNLGNLANDVGDTARAVQLLEKSLAHWRNLGHRQGIAMALNNLANALASGPDQARVAALLRESLAILHEVGDRMNAADCLQNLGSVAVEQGQLERAARLLGAAEALRERLGVALGPLDRAASEPTVAALRERLGAENAEAAWQRGRSLSLDEAVALALSE